MDIRELRSFAKVVQCGSFSRAAAELHIAQPALSRQIAKLEEQLQVKLLQRHARGAELTAAGAKLLERAQIMMKLLDETPDHVRSTSDQERGHLAVGLPPAIGAVIGPKLVRSFRQRWPRASLHVLEGSSSSLQEWTLDGRIEVAVVYNQMPLEAVIVRPLFSERMLLLGPAGTLSNPVRLSQLSDYPLILPGFPHTNRRLIEQAAIQCGVRLNVAMEVDSVSLAKRLVADGQGFSILAHAAVQLDILSGMLSGQTIERPAIRSTVSVTTLRDRRLSRLALSWQAIVIETVQDLVSRGDWKAATTWLDA